MEVKNISKPTENTSSNIPCAMSQPYTKKVRAAVAGGPLANSHYTSKSYTREEHPRAKSPTQVNGCTKKTPIAPQSEKPLPKTRKDARRHMGPKIARTKEKRRLGQMGEIYPTPNRNPTAKSEMRARFSNRLGRASRPSIRCNREMQQIGACVATERRFPSAESENPNRPFSMHTPTLYSTRLLATPPAK